MCRYFRGVWRDTGRTIRPDELKSKDRLCNDPQSEALMSLVLNSELLVLCSQFSDDIYNP